MLAIVKDPTRSGLQVEEVPVPSISPWEVLVKVRAVGICGSDQRIFREVLPQRRRKFIVGHEISGEVAACGERVDGVAVGTRVGVEICIGCAICEFCRRGLVNLCEKLEELGVTVDGGMGEFVAVPARNIHPLPPGLSFEMACLADPLACVIRGLEMVPVEVGAWVAILGPGPMGLLATQVVKRVLRARAVVVGTRPERLELARAMGADAVVHAREGDPAAAVRDVCDGGPATVLEVAGSPEALEQGIAMARKGGAVVIQTVHQRIQVQMEPAIRGEIKLFGSICYNYKEYQQALHLLGQGKLEVEPLVRHRFPLAQAVEAFDFVMSRRGVKALILPQG